MEDGTKIKTTEKEPGPNSNISMTISSLDPEKPYQLQVVLIVEMADGTNCTADGKWGERVHTVSFTTRSKGKSSLLYNSYFKNTWNYEKWQQVDKKLILS